MSSSDELAWLDATAQAELVRRRELAPKELIEAAQRRIELLNPWLNAVVTTIEPVAGSASGPFSGVPFLVKDLAIELAGTHFTEGSRWLRDHVSTRDQELALRYRRAGLTILGKTNTPEFGLLPTCEPALFGATRNPWAPTRSTGGSSGGAAAAVALGLVPMAHGNDLAGSLRYPAAWCGVFGLKPTRARSSLGPEYGDLGSGMAVEHALTRSVRDSAALLDAVAGPALGDPYCAPPARRPFVHEVGAAPGRLRIAVSPAPRCGQPIHADYAAAVHEAAALLEALGHHVEEARPAELGERYDAALQTVLRAMTGFILGYWVRRVGRAPRDDEIEPHTRAHWEMARSIGAADYLVALDELQRVSRGVAVFFQTYDAWLFPTLGGPPWELGQLASTPGEPLRGTALIRERLVFDVALANVTGNPAMSIPLAQDREGLPVGMHFLGRFGDEATLLRLAAQLESARPWAQRRPGANATGS